MANARTKVLLLGAAAATVGVYVGAFLLFTTDDRPDQIDTAAVEQVATDACIRLRVAVDAAPPLAAGAPLDARQARVGEQEQLVARLVSDVQSVGPQALDEDVPAREWLADWQVLVQARRAFLDAGGAGGWALPVLDGRVVSERMDGIGVDACRVPDALKAAP